MSRGKVSRLDRLALPLDPATVARVQPAAYYAAQDAARAAAADAVTDEERAAESYWECLDHATRAKMRRRFADAVFAEGAPDLAVLAYRVRGEA